MEKLASLELIGELMKAIHHIRYWTELETKFDLVVIIIKCDLNFFRAKNTSNKLTAN